MPDNQYASKRDNSGVSSNPMSPPTVSSRLDVVHLRESSLNSSTLDKVMRHNSGDMSDIRLRPAPQSIQRRAGIVSTATRIELSTNIGIQSKMELNEDRALSMLVRQIVLLISDAKEARTDTTRDTQRAFELLDLYVLREVQLRYCQSGCTKELLKSVSDTIEDIIRDTHRANPFSIKDTVDEASRCRVRKLEYNSIAKSITDKRPKIDSQAELSDLGKAFDALQASNTRLIRISEFRRKQLMSLSTWMDVLCSGEF